MKLRVNPRIAAKPTVIRVINGKIINFGSRGAFIRERAETKKSAAYEELVHAPTEEDLKYIKEKLGSSNLVQEYDEVAEEATMKAIEAQKEAIKKAQAEYEANNKVEAKAATAGTPKANGSGNAAQSK